MELQELKKLMMCTIALLISSIVFAQTSPLEKSPQTLAQEMVQNVATDVTLNQEQTVEILAAATQYFSDLRNAADSASEVRSALYVSFEESLKDMMTEGVYEQWKNIRQERCTQVTQKHTFTK